MPLYRLGHHRVMATPTTLLVFIHGPCLGPWIWPRSLIELFEERGLVCFSPDLHEAWPQPQWSRQISRLPLSRYVERLHGLLKQWPGRTILIGHSTGARIAHALVTRGLRDGLVMIAPPPEEGAMPQVRALARGHRMPMLNAWWQQRPRLCVGSPDQPDVQAVRDWLLYPGAPVELAQMLADRLRDDSFVACREGLGRNPGIADPTVPTLVIGGREDRLVPVASLRHTASLWQAKAHVIPHAGHCPMLGDTGRVVGRHIERWLFDRDAPGLA